MNIILNKNIEVLESKDKLIIRNTKEGKKLHLKNSTILKEVLSNSISLTTVQTIHNNMKKSNLNIDELKDIVEFFVSKNILIKNPKDNKLNDRYSRQTEFWESLFSIEDGNILQNKIENQHVVIIGAGGIGTWMSLFLTQIGIGKITLIDSDSVEDSNLARQVLFDENDIGKNKVEVLHKKLSHLNSNVEIKVIKDIISKKI